MQGIIKRLNCIWTFHRNFKNNDNTKTFSNKKFGERTIYILVKSQS